MRFLVDAQPKSLADALRRAGDEAVHVADLGLATGTDRQICDEAIARSDILITKDSDFAAIRAAKRDGPAILWVRIGNVDNRKLIAQLVRGLPRIRTAIDRGDAVVEFVGK